MEIHDFIPIYIEMIKFVISVLNTWRGELESCQTIRSILLILVTLFHNKPLLNEPGIKESHIHLNLIIK